MGATKEALGHVWVKRLRMEALLRGEELSAAFDDESEAEKRISWNGTNDLWVVVNPTSFATRDGVFRQCEENGVNLVAGQVDEAGGAVASGCARSEASGRCQKHRDEELPCTICAKQKRARSGVSKGRALEPWRAPPETDGEDLEWCHRHEMGFDATTASGCPKCFKAQKCEAQKCARCRVCNSIFLTAVQ